MDVDEPPLQPDRASGGRVVLVATPIGNLGDLSPRAAEALLTADVIAAEDTRRTSRLLAHVGRSAPPLQRYDEHTEQHRTDDLLDRAAAGQLVVNKWCLEMGGHARTGLEDNVRWDKERLAKSNAELVARVAQLCEESGRNVATPAEARALLRLAA